MTAEQRLEQLGLKLPPPPQPAGVYQPIVLDGPIAYVSGLGPLLDSGQYITGRVGDDLDLDAAKAAARQTALAILATLRKHLGSLDRIDRFLKLVGFVNCTSDFQQHPAVINGCSELLADLFGPDRGVPARSALGAPSLPMNIPVEIEAIVRLR